MRRYCFRSPMGFCLGLLVLAGCAAQPGGTASQPPVPALQPGMARVWVLRQPSSPGGNVAASDPMVFVNGQPLAQSAQGTVFFHDFQPGTYRFTVQPYGTPSQPRRHAPACTRDGGLCPSPAGAQLGTGLRRGRQLCRDDDVARRGPSLSADDDQSRSALILLDVIDIARRNGLKRFFRPRGPNFGAGILASAAPTIANSS